MVVGGGGGVSTSSPVNSSELQNKTLKLVKSGSPAKIDQNK